MKRFAIKGQQSFVIPTNSSTLVTGRPLRHGHSVFGVRQLLGVLVHKVADALALGVSGDARVFHVLKVVVLAAKFGSHFFRQITQMAH